jgi:outer membrane immunogenic protein
MNKLMLGIIAVAAVATAPAVAADLRARPVYKAAPPPPPAFSWTGCYLGGNVGGAWAYKSVSDPLGTYTPFIPGQDLGDHSAEGFVGGGQVGCDYQVGSWVIGGQGMFNWSDLSGDNLQPNALVFNQTHIPWITTATGRLGFLGTPNLLIYLKAGGAWVRDDYSSASTAGLLLASASVTRSGWTAGGGFEQAFRSGWSWFAEYNYMDFGTNNVTFATNTVPSATFPIDVQQDLHMIVVGVNYRFSTGRWY